MDDKAKIHKMLSIMQNYYNEKDEKNVDKIYDLFFDEKIQSSLIGTDNGEWFRTVEQIKELFDSDWKYWGDLHIDTYDFSLVNNDFYYMVTIKGFLDFKDDHAWDINIHMILEDREDKLVCKMMQFAIPRNIIRPTVIINESEIENEKYKIECKELREYNSKYNYYRSKELEELQKLLIEEILSARPYATDIDLPVEQLMLEKNGKSFYFCCSGSFKDSRNGNLLPFRIIGIGESTYRAIKITNHELSLPFVCKYG